MQHKKINTIRQGKTSLTVTTTTDDETGIKTQEIVTVKRGRFQNRMKFESDLATGRLLTVNGLPMQEEPSESETLYAKMLRSMVAGLNEIEKRDAGQGAE